MEDELNKTINTLKQDYEKLQNEQSKFIFPFSQTFRFLS
jgi:hypothetical protein